MPPTRSDGERPQILEGNTFIADLDFLIDVPPHLPQCRQLQAPLAPEVFCSYRPTMMEYQRLFNVIYPSALGPPVELLYAADVYKVNPDASRRKLHADDAALLIGDVPGIERLVEDNNLDAPPEADEQTPVEPAAAQLVHPMKPDVKPARIFNLRLHEVLSTRTLVPASVVDYQPHKSSFRLLLLQAGGVSERILNFAAYSGEVKRDKPARLRYIKDHLVRMADVGQQQSRLQHLLVRLPLEEPPPQENGEAPVETALFVRLQAGGKLVFSRNAAERPGVPAEIMVPASATPEP